MAQHYKSEKKGVSSGLGEPGALRQSDLLSASYILSTKPVAGFVCGVGIFHTR